MLSRLQKPLGRRQGHTAEQTNTHPKRKWGYMGIYNVRFVDVYGGQIGVERFVESLGTPVSA